MRCSILRIEPRWDPPKVAAAERDAGAGGTIPLLRPLKQPKETSMKFSIIVALTLGCWLASTMVAAQPSDLLEFPGVWSWEETAATVDIVGLANSLPTAEAISIDEQTLRGVVEGIAGRALAQMGLEGRGGQFEAVLREELLYFTPEFEYFWPPYSQGMRFVRWPITVEAAELRNGVQSVAFVLGRPLDDERTLIVSMSESQLTEVRLIRKQYRTGTTASRQSLWLSFAQAQAAFYDDEGALDGTISGPWVPKMLFMYGKSEPQMGTAVEMESSKLDGIQLLLEPHPSDNYPLSVEVYDPRATGQVFEIIRSLIALAKGQLSLQSNGSELERVLREQFFEFNPWQPLGEDAALAFLEPAYELVSIRTLSGRQDGELVYRWVLTVMLARSDETAIGLSLNEIVFKRPVAFAIDELGEEIRIVRFEHDNHQGFGAVFQKFITDPQGRVNIPLDEQIIARF